MTAAEPPTMPTPLDHFAPASGSVADVAAALRANGHPVCALDDLARTVAAPPPPAGTLEQVLDALVAAQPAYRWRRTEGGLVEVAPAESVLDEPAAARDWPRLLRELERLGVVLFSELAGPPPELELPPEAATVRELLNATVRALGRAAWQISGRDGSWFLTIVAVEQGRP